MVIRFGLRVDLLCCFFFGQLQQMAIVLRTVCMRINVGTEGESSLQSKTRQNCNIRILHMTQYNAPTFMLRPMEKVHQRTERMSSACVGLIERGDDDTG